MRFLGVLLLIVAGFAAFIAESRWLRDTDPARAQSLQRVIGCEQSAYLKELIRAGADPNSRDEKGITPLLYAALFGRATEAGILIDSGALVSACDQRGWTPCMLAAAGGHDLILERLIEAGADINALSDDGRTALSFAINNEHPKVIQLLIAAGATGEAPSTAPNCARNGATTPFSNSSLGQVSQ